MNLIYEKKIKIVSQVDKKYEQIFVYVKSRLFPRWIKNMSKFLST